MFAALAFSLGALAAAHGQNASASAASSQKETSAAKQLPAAADEAAVEARRRAFDEAKDFARHGNIAAAEDRLVRQSDLPLQSAEWHGESASQLAALASAMARDNQPDAVAALASRALQHLSQAHALAGNARAKSQSRAHAGWIQENLTGDVPAAIASYQAAVELAPDNKAAAEALERLKATEANLRAKIQAARE
jgi:hypothetical protein